MTTISEPVVHDEVADSSEDSLQDSLQDSLEVHRDGPLSLLVGGTSGVLAVAFLLRAVGSGGLLSWAMFLVTAGVAVMHLAAVVDARAPLLVIDRLGVRVRRGASWQGVAWSEVDRVEHLARASTLRDGSLTVHTDDGRRLGLRLSLSTRLIGADWHEVDEALEELSGGAVPIVALSRSNVLGDEASAEADADADAPEIQHEPQPEAQHERVPEPASEDDTDVLAPVSPTRESRPARRTEMFVSPTARLEVPDVSAELLEESHGGAWSEPSSEGETETILINGLLDDVEDPAEGPAPREPVVGRPLAVARERIGISVEALAERTRIRPHVIESIEVDDFTPCGGDFYARGHLRTLARVLGVEATELLALYDEHYAHAPIDARRVFEAELASAPSGGQRSGSRVNWSVLVASVMAVVLVWSVARLVMDGPVPLSDQPVLNGSPGGRATLSGATTKVPVTLTAATGGARVIVRDARQQVVFDAQLAFMQTAELTVAPPVRVSTTDGGLLVSIDGVDEGALGATGQDAQRTYVP